MSCRKLWALYAIVANEALETYSDHALITWLLDPRHAALITWIGFLIGVVGTALGLLGLWLALRQLRAIKTETEAATLAIQLVQLKVASFDTAQECHVAVTIISEIRNGLTQADWSYILLNYEKLMQSFLKLSHANSSIDTMDREILKKYTGDMANMCGAIRKRLLEGQLSFFLKGQDRALRNFSDIVTKISFGVTKDLQK